ncbi:hypothetical protein ACMWQB_26220, partial [Escherichia coli]|uniref:hypothetical protein n=1 Tax=Escherichia coli TaxID=562 RepID=UPI0039E1DF7C
SIFFTINNNTHHIPISITLQALNLSNKSIYHNSRCPHRLRRPQRVSDGKPEKQATNHPKNCRDRA